MNGNQTTTPPLFNFRLRPDDAAAIDAARVALDRAAPGIKHTRADVVRIALARLAAEVAPAERGAP